MDPQQLPHIILDALKDFQRHRWIRRVLISALYVLAFGLCATLLLMAGDAWLRWDDNVRTFCSFCLWLVISAYLIRNLIWPLIRTPNLVKIAQDFEQQFPDGLHQQISSAVDFSTQSAPGSQWMAQRCIAAATQRIDALDYHIQARIKSQRRLRSLCLLLIIGWLFLLIPSHTRSYTLRSLSPWLNIPRPTDISFTVEPGNINVASGTDISLRVRCTPKVEHLDCVVRWGDGHQEIIPCTQTESSSPFWHLYIGPALDSFSYTLRSGNDESQRYHIQVGAAAEVVDTSIQVTPPHYIREGNRILHNGDTDVLIGSQLHFYARVQNFNVHHAQLKGDENWSLSLDCKQDGDDVIISGTWQAEQSLHCSLHLWNQEGLHHQHPQQWFIRVNQDAKPVIQIDHGLGETAMAAANDHIQLNINAEDDFGIERMSLQLGNQHGILLSQEIPIAKTQKSIQHTVQLDLGQWSLHTGDRLYAVINCRDNSGQSIASERALWTINTPTLAQVARHINIIKKVNQELQELLQQCHVLANRWSDIRSNARIDDIQAQSGDLLQADQHLRSISLSLDAVHQKISQVYHKTGKTYQSALETPHAISGYLLHHHCPWLLGRGAFLLESSSTDLSALLDHAVIDSELILKQCERLLGASQAAEARLGVDVLESDIAMSQFHIGFLGSHLLRDRLWKEPLYHNALRSSIYQGQQIEGNPSTENNLSVKISNTIIPDIGQFNYAIQWQGEIFIPNKGQWAFDVQSDDGIQIAINNQEILSKDAWKTQGITGFNSSLELNEGWHRIDIRYFQGTGDSQLSIQLGLKGEKNKDINSFRLRSPSLHQNKPELIAHMLLPQNRSINWDQAKHSIQSMLDASLYVHNWAIDTSQSQLHRIAQQLNTATAPYQSALEQSFFSGPLQQALNWKPIQTKSFFQQIRQILDEEITARQLPVDRQVSFDDLIIHVHFMQQLSRSLKDWGLPYEQIAQTHRFLKRLQEQLIVLHQRNLNELSSQVSDSKTSLGERRVAWEMNEKLSQSILEKITGLEVDSQNVIWQLTALHDSLMNIYLEHKDWRLLLPTELAAASSVAHIWKSTTPQTLSTEDYHLSFQQHILEQYRGTFRNHDTLQKSWQTFNQKPPSNTVKVIDEFLKPLKRRSKIDGPSLKHLWQLALLESEYLFSQHKTQEAKAAFYIAVRLQQQLEQDDNTPRDIQNILETAKHIARNKGRLHKSLLNVLQHHEDQHVQRALKFDLALEQIREKPMSFTNLLSNVSLPPRTHINSMDWTTWRAQLEKQFEQAELSMGTILHDYIRSFRAAHSLRKKFISQLQLVIKDNASQAIRWQRLAKDLQSINADGSQQNGFEIFQVGIEQERQLHVYCLEQASYSRNRYSSFGFEDDNAYKQLTDLISLRDSFHEVNANLLSDLKHKAQRQYQQLNIATAYILPDNHAEHITKEHRSIWQQLRNEINKSTNELKFMRELSHSIDINYSHRQVTNWKKRLSSYLNHLKRYWKKILSLQEHMSGIPGQSALVIKKMQSEIDILHIELLQLYHQQGTLWLSSKELSTSILHIIQQCFADLTYRVDLNKHLIRQHYERSPLDEQVPLDFMESWHNYKFQINCNQTREELFNAMINDLEIDDTLLQASHHIVDQCYAQAARLLHQRGQHVPTPLPSTEHQQLFLQQSNTDDFQRRYEQQWQQTQTLIELRSPYEDYDAFTNDQQLTIFDYFKSVSTSEP